MTEFTACGLQSLKIATSFFTDLSVCKKSGLWVNGALMKGNRSYYVSLLPYILNHKTLSIFDKSVKCAERFDLKSSKKGFLAASGPRPNGVSSYCHELHTKYKQPSRALLCHKIQRRSVTVISKMADRRGRFSIVS